jgi:hypothetical protein
MLLILPIKTAYTSSFNPIICKIYEDIKPIYMMIFNYLHNFHQAYLLQIPKRQLTLSGHLLYIMGTEHFPPQSEGNMLLKNILISMV